MAAEPKIITAEAETIGWRKVMTLPRSSGVITRAMIAVCMVEDASQLVAVAGRRSNVVTKARKLDDANLFETRSCGI